MSFKINISKQASKFVLKQPVNLRKRLLNAINRLPYSGDIKVLVGKDNMLRLRVGDYRIIFRVDFDIGVIEILKIDR